MIFYGLRTARSLLKKVKTVVKGETDTYAKGWRDALKHLDLEICREIEKNKVDIESKK